LQHKYFAASRITCGSGLESTVPVRPMRIRYHAHFVSQHS